MDIEEEIRVPDEVKGAQRDRFLEIAGILRKSGLIGGITPERLRAVLEELGPTYVKIGQIMSMRPDMIPQEYCAELSKLRTDVDPMPRDQIEAALEAAYGSDWKATFKDFVWDPLGSASIAQAHKAVLKDGSVVAMKIERPGIFEMMSEDVALLRKAAGVLKLLQHGDGVIDFGALLDEMWEVAQEEMDFMVEARNNAAFTEYNEDYPRVTCPHIYTEYTTSKVLVMEYIDGISVGKPEEIRAAGWDPNDLGDVLVNNYMKQCLDDGFFHADPHPGNIWVRDNEIVWIDMGMMGHLSSKDRELIGDAVSAVASRDTNALKDVVLSLGVFKGRVSHPKLYGDIDTYLSKYGSLDLDSLDFGAAVQDLMDVAHDNGISMPNDISMFVRGIATMEGTVKVLCPDIPLVKLFSDHMEESAMKSFDPAAKAKDMARKLYASGSKSVEIPSLVTDLMRMVMRGQLMVNTQVEVEDSVTRSASDLIDRLVIGLVVSAFLIGSSFLCTTDMEPKILGVPALGVVGFIVALVFAVWLIVDSMRKKHR